MAIAKMAAVARQGMCAECGSPIFRPISWKTWVHVAPRTLLCMIQQASDHKYVATHAKASDEQAEVDLFIVHNTNLFAKASK